MKLTYLFILHDLSVIKFMSDRIAIMYLLFASESLIPERLPTKVTSQTFIIACLKGMLNPTCYASFEWQR